MTIWARWNAANKALIEIRDILDGITGGTDRATIYYEIGKALMTAKLAIRDVTPDEDGPDEPPRKLTRQERLQGMADRGCDTWEEYRGER